MKTKITLIFFLFFFINTEFSIAQKKAKSKAGTEVSESIKPPKLVVGIVVDQMRYDYLSRFGSHFTDGGFNRLVKQGFNCHNHHFNYAPTKTAPGHAAIYTGATPKLSGIMGNSWFDRKVDSVIYCVDDHSVSSVGTRSVHGQKSPHRMDVNTITDQLRLHSQFRSKTIAISFKDRGSVLPGGYLANAAYWFYGKSEGKFISSSYYMQSLPGWVQAYNDSDAISRYKKAWIPMKDLQTYEESGPDNTNYEHIFTGEDAPVMPRNIPGLWEANGEFDLLKYTPFSNTITTDFALEAIKNEGLGMDEYTDFLAISYSATDEIGHKYGVNSKEIQDTYLRLDRDLEHLFNSLDEIVGSDKYLVFLTADHGAVHVPSYLVDNKLAGGYFSIEENIEPLNQFLEFKYGPEDLIKGRYNNQIFLDSKLIDNLDLSAAEVQQTLADELKRKPQILLALTATQLSSIHKETGIYGLLANGYNQKLSGDIYYVLKPGYLDYDRTGSDHGSPHVYDTHVPLIFYGSGIKKGHTYQQTVVTDIAPTLAAILRIAVPNGSMGQPIEEVLK